MARIFSYSGRHAKISLKITDKEPIFADLSVSKTHFTDKPAFSNDLSVNFWPLCWEFTDKAGFFEHFSIETFTDRRPIFIDVSVNENDFAKCSVSHHLLNHCTWPWLRAKRWFMRFDRNLRLRSHSFGEGARVEHFFNFWRFRSAFHLIQVRNGTFFKASPKVSIQQSERLFKQQNNDKIEINW